MSKLFYKLPELAERWGQSEITLLHWGASGKMAISTCLNIFEAEPGCKKFFEGKYREQIFVIIRREDLLRLAVEGHSIKTSIFKDQEDQDIRNCTWEALGEMYWFWDLDVHEKNLFVMPREVSRMEAEYPEIKSGKIPAEEASFEKVYESNTPPLLSNDEISSLAGENTNILHKTGGRPRGLLAEAVDKAYLHFRDRGDVAILQPGNIRSFLKIFKSLLNDDVLSPSFGNGNIRAYLAERIKEVKIPFAGECFVVTHNRKEGRKINPGYKYSQKAIAKLLTNLRKKYPLPS